MADIETRISKLHSALRSPLGRWVLPLFVSAIPPGCGDSLEEEEIAVLSSAATATISISGQIIGTSGGGVAGVTLTLSGTRQAMQISDAEGHYSFTQLPPGSFSVLPSRAGCSFVSQVVNLNGLASSVVQSFGASGPSCLGTPPAEGGPPPPASPAIHEFVVLASGPIGLGDRDTIPAGNLGTSSPAGTPFALIVGHDASAPGNLFGRSVELLDRATVGNVSTDQLTGPFATHLATSRFVIPPGVPTARPFAAGSLAITVAAAATRVLAPGQYGAIAVQGTLRLSGGLYQLASLTLGPAAVLSASAPSVVRVTGRLTAADRTKLIVAGGLGASALRLVVGAQGADAVAIGTDVRLTGLLLAPAGGVTARDRLHLSGAAAAAGAIALGNDAQVDFDAAFECSTDAQCDDANVCTTDACGDGFCVHAAVADGAVCDDGDACTQTDRCQAGTCAGSDPVACAASDQCHVAGSCDPASGVCSNPDADDETGCDDGDACTRTDTCQAGVCTGGDPRVCLVFDPCLSGSTCNSGDGSCENIPQPDGTACPFGSGTGTCANGTCVAGAALTISSSGGDTLFSSNVPTSNTFAYSATADDLGSAPGGGRKVVFTPGAFPPGQQVIAYDFPYGLTADDEGGANAVSDVLSGHWICLPTEYASLSAPSGQTISVPDVFVDHVVRYVDGVCRARIPLQPLFHELENQIVGKIQQDLPGIVSFDFFEFAQPQFRGRGSNLQMGFLFEALYKFSVGATLATVSLDPAFTVGLRASDGLIHIATLERNVTTLGLADSFKPKIDAALADTAGLEDKVNAVLSPPMSQLVSVLGLPADSVVTSCTTPTPAAPSPECFNNVISAIHAAVSSVPGATQATDLAAQFFGPINFTCDNSNQCRFHPVFQGVNILPDSLEIVLAPDLRNPSNPLNSALTAFIQLLGPQSISRTVQLGSTPVTVSVDCSLPAASSARGHITTVFTGSTDLAQGIPCGGFAVP
jgi:hypothetical protein